MKEISVAQNNFRRRLLRFIASALGIAPVSTESVQAISMQTVSQYIRTVPQGDDYLWAGPAHECICGNSLFIICAWFADGELAGYFTEGMCSACGSTLRIPTPIDTPLETENFPDD